MWANKTVLPIDEIFWLTFMSNVDFCQACMEGKLTPSTTIQHWRIIFSSDVLIGNTELRAPPRHQSKPATLELGVMRKRSTTLGNDFISRYRWRLIDISVLTTVTYRRQTGVWRGTSISYARQCSLVCGCRGGTEPPGLTHTRASTDHPSGMFCLFAIGVGTWKTKYLQ